MLDVVLGDERRPPSEASAVVLRAVAEVMMNRPEDALNDLAAPTIGNQHDAPLWRAIAYAHQGKWAEAREALQDRRGDDGDAAGRAAARGAQGRAARRHRGRRFRQRLIQLNDFETIGVPRELEPAIAVLIGRLAEGMGRSEDALTAYRNAADSWDRPRRGAGPLARDRAALFARRSQARQGHSRA